MHIWVFNPLELAGFGITSSINRWTHGLISSKSYGFICWVPYKIAEISPAWCKRQVMRRTLHNIQQNINLQEGKTELSILKKHFCMLCHFGLYFVLPVDNLRDEKNRAAGAVLNHTKRAKVFRWNEKLITHAPSIPVTKRSWIVGIRYSLCLLLPSWSKEI